MKTSHEDYEKVLKNTGNLDTINILATNESKETKTEQTHSTAPKIGMTRLGVRRRSSQWKEESKGVVV